MGKCPFGPTSSVVQPALYVMRWSLPLKRRTDAIEAPQEANEEGKEGVRRLAWSLGGEAGWHGCTNGTVIVEELNNRNNQIG